MGYTFNMLHTCTVVQWWVYVRTHLVQYFQFFLSRKNISESYYALVALVFFSSNFSWITFVSNLLFPDVLVCLETGFDNWQMERHGYATSFQYFTVLAAETKTLLDGMGWMELISVHIPCYIKLPTLAGFFLKHKLSEFHQNHGKYSCC